MNTLNRSVALTLGLVAVLAGCPTEDAEETGAGDPDTGGASETDTTGSPTAGVTTEPQEAESDTSTDPTEESTETGTESTGTDSDSTDTSTTDTTTETTDTTNGTTDTTTGVEPVTFDDIDQFFQVCTGCHPNQGIPTTYNGILNFNPPGTNLPYVDPGNPEGSYLYIRLGGNGVENLPNFTTPMPPSNGLVASNPAAFALIEQWILDGALP